MYYYVLLCIYVILCITNKVVFYCHLMLWHLYPVERVREEKSSWVFRWMTFWSFDGNGPSAMAFLARFLTNFYFLFLYKLLHFIRMRLCLPSSTLILLQFYQCKCTHIFYSLLPLRLQGTTAFPQQLFPKQWFPGRRFPDKPLTTFPLTMFGRMTFGRMTFGRMTFGRMTFGRMTFGRNNIW
jgi:hypothetical protein